MSDFLRALKPSAETINLRLFTPDRDTKRVIKSSCTLTQLIRPETIDRLSKANKTHGIYAVVNDGGDLDDEITRLNACFVESDTSLIAQQNLALDGAPIETSARVETKKSVHAYFFLEDGYDKDNYGTEEEWEEVLAKWREAQIGLIHHFDADEKLKNPSRVMRLPEFDHISKDGSRKQVKLTQLEPEKRYTLEELLEAFPAPELKPSLKVSSATTPHALASESKFKRFESSELEECKRETGKRVKLIGKTNRAGKIDFKCPQHNGNGNTSAFYDPESNNFHCNHCKGGLDIVALLERFSVHWVADNQQEESDEKEREIISQKDKKKTQRKALFDKLLEDRLTGKAIEKPEFIIKGLVEKENINLFAGPKKFGKSMFLQAGLCACGFRRL